MKVSLVKKPDALFPMTPHDLEVFAKIPNGLRTIQDIKEQRNVKLFNKIWPILRMVAASSDNFRDEYEVRDAILILAGFCRPVYLLDGGTYFKPDSISFEKCTDEKFKKIWEAALPHFCKLLDCTEDEIDKNLIFYM